MRLKVNRIKYIVYLLVVMMTMGACSDTLETINGSSAEQGEPILFTTLVPDVSQNTRAAQDDWKKEVDSYKAVNQDYTFNIEMWKLGADQVSGSGTYQPITEDRDEQIVYSPDGTLKNIENPLYWQDNVSKWGFKATAGTDNIEADQTTQEKWLAQDRLVGYSYLPIWDADSQKGVDDFNSINYRTSKEWYADNKKAQELSGLMSPADSDGSEYKKIPLYMQHERAWVTIILKAGEGVTREALAYATSEANIKTTIYSYKEGASKPLEINAWSREELIDYDSDKNGAAATGVSTTRYDAIVDPHNFIASRKNEESDIIARISVSNQNFTFAAANDQNYGSYIADDATEEVKEKMQIYNLQPGKHLTITATLTRASRMIMITAWIEDWTETITGTICDDYGQNGDPILINNATQLAEFLSSTDMNAPGNVGLIVPNALSLADTIWDGSGYTLKATLNLASTKLSIKTPFVKAIDRTGSLINGDIIATEAFEGATAIADENYGTVERVHVNTLSETTQIKATKAGLINANYGTIYQCSSALPVEGTAGYVGGIAATSLFHGDDGVSPVIDACTVSARVDGGTNVTAGGGIVGQAEGRVTNNTFEYGVTLLQDPKFYNIIGAVGTSTQGLTHSNNAWPTTADYTVSSVKITNSNVGARYDAVIDRRDELKKLLESGYNAAGKIYRVANSFTVDKENWIWGNDILKEEYFATNVSSEGYAHGMVKFTLDGNDKTITLDGTNNATMLFGSVIGEVYDLNLLLAKPIIADRITDIQNKDDSNTDAIAAFAYAVTTAGEANGVVRNISLKAAEGAYIESTTPGGIAVWASHGGKLVNCVSNVPIKMHLTTTGTDARHYAGGIVAQTEKATITQCKYYGGSGSISWSEEDAENAKKSNSRYGGIVGGTSEIANSNDKPSLVLSDCYSWWELPQFDPEVTVRPVMGSIIGSTVYHDPSDNTKLYNAMADENAGNWWSGTTGVGLLLSGVTEDKAIGRKNLIPPTKPHGW